MKAHLRRLVAGLDPVAARNLLREYLQARILEGLQRAGAMSSLAFQGGTALRFLYGLPRYSEDLDFAMERRRPDRDPGRDLRAWLAASARQLRREGYKVAVSVRDRTVVHVGWVRFPGLLHEVGLSPHAEEVLGIKVDVDTQPPAGAVTEVRLVRRHASLRLHHHDCASLLAGKLHAVLARPWTKGRDLFDLAWYLSDPMWPPPNLALLNAALRQGDAEAAPVSPGNWRNVVRRRVETLDWRAVVTDVRPFLGVGVRMPEMGEVLALLEP